MEELVLDTNNLCTTEDAFEQFQSGAMYEEDEFITLSDIVSSPHTNQDVNEILHDDPCDEVSMSIQEEKMVNNIDTPPFKQNEVSGVISEIKQNNKEKTSKKRGRKKKGSYDNNDVQQTQCEIDLNKPTKPKRRSRKSFMTSDTNSDSKYVQECVVEDQKVPIHMTGTLVKPANKAKRKSHTSITPEDVKEQKKRGRKAKQTTKKLLKESVNEVKNQEIGTTNIDDNNINTPTATVDKKKNKQKRGRKKHNISCQNPVSDDIKTQAKISEINSIISSTPENNKLENTVPILPLYEETNKKPDGHDKPNFTNGKKIINTSVAESVENYMSEDDIEDLPLSNLSRKSENELNKNVDLNTTLESTNRDFNINTKNNTTNCKEKIEKKRGRPKKNSLNSLAKPELDVKKFTNENNEKCDHINDIGTQENQNKFENPEIISEPVLSSVNEPEVLEADDKIDTNTNSNSQSKRNSKKKLRPDFEYNVDSVVKNDKIEDTQKIHEEDENLDTEDSSRRSVRRRVLKNWNYDEGSDEDPYANVESSDDEPRRRKKGGRYYSDDDYFPGNKRQLNESESDIALDEDVLDINNKPQKKKKSRKSDILSNNKSPRKKSRKSDAESICTTEKTNTNTDSGDVDFEDLESTITRGNDDQETPTKSIRDNQSWGKKNEIQNFLAKIQGTDIKISKKSADKVKTSLQIPVIEATEAKKSVEKSAQTATISTKSAGVQTDTAYEIPMKDQVPLTGEQSEKACDFLSGIVQTTAELGQLMTQKSEDFITKKINTKYVTDTYKMDYCVKKSFLLFKLAKHNLVQMEEDLSKQYEEFLKENNLIQHREEQKIIASTSKTSDSDCEIVEEPVKNKDPPKAQKPAFNPKTVFLNKELSIKIAKKSTEEPAPKKKLNIKGRSSVWINDSVLVKKVKPNQSFLAQDSRNKKPPDNKITLEMVKNFFRMYERQKAMFICAPYIKTEWFGRHKTYMCNYFVDSTTDFQEKTVIQNEHIGPEVAFVEHDPNHVIGRPKTEDSIESCPETLSLICTRIVQNFLHRKELKINTNDVIQQSDFSQRKHVAPYLQSLTNNVEGTQLLISDINKNIICFKPNYNKVESLKTLCFKRVMELMNSAYYSNCITELTSKNQSECVAAFYENETISIIKIKKKTANLKKIKSLLSLCIKAIQKIQKSQLPRNINNINYKPKSLKSLSLFKVLAALNGITKNTSLEQKKCNVKSLIQMCIDITNNIASHGNFINNTNLKLKNFNVKTLLQSSIDAINNTSFGSNITNSTDLEPKDFLVRTPCFQLSMDATGRPSCGNMITNNTILEQQRFNIKPLLQLCIDATNKTTYGNSITNNTTLEPKFCNMKFPLQLCIEVTNRSSYGDIRNDTSIEQKCCNLKTLLQLCVEATNTLYFDKANKVEPLFDSEIFEEKNNTLVNSVLPLKLICRNKITELSTEWYSRQTVVHEVQSEKSILNFTINNVNTVSDDVFLDATSDGDLGDVDNDNYIESSYKNEKEQHNYSDEECGTNYDLDYDDNNWVSQVQMQELRSCLDTSRKIEIEDKISEINQNTGLESIVVIKRDPDEYQPETVDPSKIKTEPREGDDHEYLEESNNYSSINIITKQEDIVEAPVRKEFICPQSSNSYDEEFFESFVRSNKMITNLNYTETPSDEIFSQSSQRVRRQYEPDSDDEIDDSTDTLNLLIPQNLESKDRLMESSQEEEDEKEYKKSDKKKPEKRKGKLKKYNKDLPNKGKILQKNEVTLLSRKMKDKIRQEQSKSESSDSEPNCLKIKMGKVKPIVNKCNNKSEATRKQEDEKVIQCNDVDSTEVITENKSNLTFQNNEKYEDPDENNFDNLTNERSPSPFIDSNEPVEVLECEPTLPIFDEFVNKEYKPESFKKLYTSDGTSFVDRHGWQCYPIDKKDDKIYTHVHVQMDKLPESFVETYFQYQDVEEKTMADLEVDKLTNLQTLQRTRPKQDDSNLGKPKTIETEKEIKVPDTSEVIEEYDNPLKKEKLEELSPSEDEVTPNINECIPPVNATNTPVQSIENHLAKKILMNNDSDTEKADNNYSVTGKADNNDSDTGKAVNNESDTGKADNNESDIGKADNNDSDTGKAVINTESIKIKLEKTEENTYTTRSGRTVKCKIEKSELWKDDLVLTADKMMNKELALLHAPVELKEEEDTKDFINKSHNKNSQKHVSKGQTTRYRIKTDDDSSSEEEKQWFTTKEKLLKRLLKKNEDARVEDAKRAKIVSEFIEKRGELPEPRQRPRVRSRESKKTIMERRKQIKILSRELFGVDSVYTKKYSPASTSKGRRNIRKVIDKKSLARSTVVANMEEFERKRRLTIRQAKLREDLGCEEGVNVVVINDELCLEYDFEEKRPVVSVDQFFTKVMKAHQYEGVKFMWDACFESVSLAGSGGAGGGCILAHCMGLGKTLQVLALLHTVLTHPQVGMRRVLVCCPLSTVLNWVDEIHKWIGPVTNNIKVFELSKLKKTYERAYQLEDWYNGGGIFIIGYELFRSLSTLDPVLDCVRPTIVNKIRTALLDPGPDIIVCDEGHLLKNDCSVLAVAMSRVVTKRRIILTGTPMQNNLREYYCMVNFVKPNLLGSYSEYSNRFENPIMNGQHRDSREEDIKLMKARTHILHKVLEGCLQRQEASVLYPYLPKKYEYTVFISLTKCQWELYKHYLTHYINTKENKQSVLRDFHVLQKIWTHPLVLNNFLMKTSEDEKDPKMKAEKLDDELEESPEPAAPSAAAWWARTDHRHVLHQLDSSYKFLVVFRLLHECVELGDKVLIFSTSLYAMDALEFFLNRENKWTLGREYYRLDGSVPAEVRQKWCREFNAPQNTSTKLFLISTRAGSLGLNMTAANRVIILDTSWNPAHDIQSIFRVYRFGQKKDCYIYRLVAMGTMEQKIYERSVTKQAVSCRVVDEQQIDRHYNSAELSELYSLDEAGSGVDAGLAAGVRDAALLRVAAGAAGGGGLHAVHEHDSLLRGSSETVLPEHERNAAWMQFQQEHATTSIQNFEMSVPKKHIEDTKVTPKKSKIKSEKDSNTNDTEDATSKVIKKTKRKKVKKKNNEQEPQPSTSHQDLDPDVEGNMIKKIMNILIKHNFHTTKTPEEISALVMNVRDVVAKAPLQSLKSVDPLTSSIAHVLLESENIKFPENNTKQTINHDEHKIADDDNNIMEMDLKERKRRRNRIDSDKEYIPDSRKRKATNKTRKSNESINNDNNSISLDSGKESTKDIPCKERDNTEIIAHKEEDSKEIIANKEEDNTEVVPNKKENTEAIANKEDNIEIMANKEKDNTEVIAKKEEDNAEVILNEEVIDKKPIVIISKKSDILKKISTELDQNEKLGKRKYKEQKISSKLNQVVTIDEKKCKQNNKKVKSAKKDVPKEKEANKIHITVENEIIDECIEVNDNCHTDNIIENIPLVQPTEDESICLSDDDEPIITEPAPLDKPETAKKNIETIEKEDTVPLHKSVLTNKNFIKLVAHTYLTGNPMLDEDAALLAAQYSTLKALKEVQATGKDVISGPIHEIATKVLGTDLMKRLFVANPNKCTSETMLLTTDDLQNKTMNEMLQNSKEEVEKQQKPDPIEVTTKQETETKTTNKRKGILRKALDAKDVLKASQSPTKSSQQAVSSETTSSKVVPVSIFKGPVAPSAQQLSVEECILPDDDDVIISVPPSPPAVPPLARRNSKQFIVNAVSSKDSSRRDQSRPQVEKLVPIATVSVTARPPSQSTTDSITPAKASLPSTIENASPNKNLPTVQNDSISENKVPVTSRKNTAPCHVTICLDSDEEDAPSVISDDITKAASDSHTLIVSPLAKKNEIKDNKMILVPVTSVSTSSPTAIETSKAPIVSIDPRKRLIKERNATSLTETKCKPGDIIRINEMGKVEVLKIVTDKEFAAKSQTKLNEEKGSANNLKNLKVPDKLVKTVLDKPGLLKEDKRKEIPSTSKQQKDPDPLSVLKNVVHIPASKYDKAKAKPSVEKPLQTSPSAQEVTVNTKLPAPKLQEVKPIITYKNPRQVIINNDKQIIKKKMDLNKPINAVKINEVPKAKGDETKELIIDLTSNQPVQIKKPNVAGRPNEVAVVADSSKDTGTKKINSVVSDSKKSNIAIVRNTMIKAKTATTSKVVPSISDSKRSSPWSEGSQSKKIKTDSKKTMTLQDFNLDDFDDIIELE